MLYDRLFNIENTADVPEGKTYLDFLNPESLTKLENAVVEPSLANATPGEGFQFVRTGYFCKDTKNPNTFNRVVGLKDSFPKN
jgi:glutaminyl-tRNA synthetase